jgi:hypothetical protein
MKRELRLLRDAPPGRRFARRHKRMLARDYPGWVRIARVLGSGLVAAAGFVFLALPGPGLLVIVLGLAMAAGEFAAVARVLDAAEVRLRRQVGRAAKWWRTAGWPARGAVLLVGLAIVGALGWIAWRIVRN